MSGKIGSFFWLVKRGGPSKSDTPESGSENQPLADSQEKCWYAKKKKLKPKVEMP